MAGTAGTVIAGRRTVLLALVAATTACDTAPSVVETRLDRGWEFRRVGDSTWYPGTVPGTVHTDLLAAGRIPDPFSGDNETRLQWIEREDWEYRTRFVVPDTQTGVHRELVFDGLDTYADVRLNDDLVLDGDNMFRTWTVDVTDQLRPGQNQLDIVFHSPIERVLPILDTMPYRLPQGNDAGDPPTRMFTRKAAYHYGWDWGARFVTSGIWRPVTLRTWRAARIADAWYRVHALTDSLAVIAAHVEIVADRADAARLTIRSPGARFRAVSRSVAVQPGTTSVDLEVPIQHPRRWWPRGYGEPYLYEVVAEVEAGGLGDARHDRIGLRTLKVVTEPDSMGESFYVRVNGVPIFARGANYIPQDQFTPRVTPERYRALFEDVAAANMNMLRVWGGGIYEENRFYDLADEYGVLIWQDFMFAIAMFPGDSAFLANVDAEAVDNVRRLRNHPSLALWCGNNEIDEAWHNWGWPRDYHYTTRQAAQVWGTYERIFDGILPRVVATLDSGRFYWPSSPSIGWGHPESMTQGDAHYWGVWHGGRPFESFEEFLPRFMSEFGFEAIPSMRTIDEFAAPSDQRLDSPVMGVHQKAPGGNDRIRTYMRDWYREPADFGALVYQSQLLQADAYRIAWESERRAMPRTMGTLYWQLDDTWPVISWSSRDYFGRWKASHYAAARAFAPVIVSPLLRDDSVEIWVVSDRADPLAGELRLTLRDFTGGAWELGHVPITVGARESREVFSQSAYQLLLGRDSSTVALEAELVNGDRVVAGHLLYFARPKNLVIPTATLHTKIWMDGDRQWVVVSSDALVKDLELSVAGTDVRFSDNYFDVFPGREYLVRVLSKRRIPDLASRLRWRSLPSQP